MALPTTKLWESSRSQKTNATVILFWASILTCYIIVLAGFGGWTVAFRGALYGSSLSILFTFATLVAFKRRSTRQVPNARGLPSGAMGAAVALSCYLAAMAWCFTVYIAYLIMPLAVFVASRSLTELRDHFRAKIRSG